MHEIVGPVWLVWLETSALALAMRQSFWLYPLVEIVHIVGFTILVGAAFMFDLRLLGVGRHLSVRAMARHLLNPSRAAAFLVVPSGLMMFAAHATEWATNPALWVKLSLIAAAGLNAAVFHRGVFRSVNAWNRDAPTPRAAKLAALLSLSLWTGTITCGRLLAYL
jgi:Family of unknown function (DUF6644)